MIGIKGFTKEVDDELSEKYPPGPAGEENWYMGTNFAQLTERDVSAGATALAGLAATFALNVIDPDTNEPGGEKALQMVFEEAKEIMELIIDMSSLASGDTPKH